MGTAVECILDRNFSAAALYEVGRSVEENEGCVDLLAVSIISGHLQFCIVSGYVAVRVELQCQVEHVDASADAGRGVGFHINAGNKLQIVTQQCVLLFGI